MRRSNVAWLALGLLTACGGETLTDNPEAESLYLEAVEHQARRFDQDQVDSAVTKLTRATELDTAFAAAWARLAHARIWQQFNFGVPDLLPEAEDALARATALDPNGVQTQLARGYVQYYGFRDYEQALEAFMANEDRTSDDPAVAGAIGNIKRRQGRWSEAVSYYERRAALAPTRAANLITLVSTQNAVGRYDAVLATAEQLDGLGHSQAPVWQFWAHFNSGDTARAWEAAEEIRRNADNPRLVTAFDLTRATVRRDDEALATMLEQSGPIGSVDARLSAYLSLERMGRSAMWRSNLEEWMGTLQASLDQPAASQAMSTVQEAGVRSTLAVLESVRGNDDEALARAREAEALDPIAVDGWVGPQILNRLAWAYISLGLNDRALAVLEGLADAELSPASAWLRLHPIYDPLRRDTRFDALISRQEARETPVAPES